MIQGGDPLGNGTGGSDQTIKGEFSANGVNNPLAHSRGVLSMARSSDMNSASSQFFIMHADASHLDGNYASFGKVLAGMNVVDALCRDTAVSDSNGTVLQPDQPVMREVTRATRAEAEKAAFLESENGQNGLYGDDILDFSFLVPDGWSLQPSTGDALIFTYEQNNAVIQVVVQDLWRHFGAEFRTSMEQKGMTRDHLNTAYFGERLTQSISGTDGISFTKAEFGGAIFFVGEKSSDNSHAYLRIGVDKGRLLCFIGYGEGVMEFMDQMMKELDNPNDEEQVREYLRKILRKQAGDGSGLIYGVGHAVYTLSDPRAQVLKKYSRDLAFEKGFGELYTLLVLIERLAPGVFYEEKGLRKNVCANMDLFSGLIYRILGIDEDLYTPIFAIARVAGWCAHRMEEVEFSNRIIRPAYKYIGK